MTGVQKGKQYFAVSIGKRFVCCIYDHFNIKHHLFKKPMNNLEQRIVMVRPS